MNFAIKPTVTNCLLIFALTLVGCADPNDTFTEVGGSYPPVTEAELIGKQSGARSGPEDFDFNWAFEEGTFSLEGKNIPPDLLQAFNEGRPALKIKGSWSLTGDKLTFSEIVVDGGKPNDAEVTLACYFTGVIRIETDDAQYVF